MTTADLPETTEHEHPACRRPRPSVEYLTRMQQEAARGCGDALVACVCEDLHRIGRCDDELLLAELNEHGGPDESVQMRRCREILRTAEQLTAERPGPPDAA